MKYSELDPQKGIIGISIGPEKVFITCLNYADRKWEIEKSISVDIAPDMVRNGIITDVQGLALALKKTVKDNDIKARQVFAGIFDFGAMMREAKIPEMPKAQMKEALKTEVDKYMLGGTEAIIDYYPLEKEKVFFVAIKKDAATTLLDTMEKAGLNLIGIDVFPFAALRALGRGPLDSKHLTDRGNIDLFSKKSAILVLASKKKTDISVIKEGAIAYSRSTDTSEVSELTKEIRITNAYWEELFPEAPIEKIVVLGDGEKEKNLHEKLPKDLGIIEQGKSLGAEPSDFNLSRTASIGLAMRGREEEHSFDINLLPPEKSMRIELEKKLLLSVISVSTILLILSIASLMLSVTFNSYERRLRPIKKELALSPDLLAKVEKINEERLYILDTLNQKKEYIARMRITPWPQILTDIKNSIPDDVWLNEISAEDENAVSLRGRAYSQDGVYKYVHLLAFSDYFQEPKLAFIRGKEKEGRSMFDFNIICPLAEKSVSKK
ncbi:MAG: PilN domain-containing protein [Candidatus Omnitrophota bacterium]